MGKPRFTEEFKIDAIKQITERGHAVADVSHRLGISAHSLYAWMKKRSAGQSICKKIRSHNREILEKLRTLALRSS